MPLGAPTLQAHGVGSRRSGCRAGLTLLTSAAGATLHRRTRHPGARRLDKRNGPASAWPNAVLGLRREPTAGTEVAQADVATAVNHAGNSRKKRGLSTRHARVKRLEERLVVERDERIRESIAAQLRAFGRGGRM